MVFARRVTRYESRTRHVSSFVFKRLLRAIAGLPNISLAVPVSFVLEFERE